MPVRRLPLHTLGWTHYDRITDIVTVGQKVIDFYRKKGGEIVSPLVKAL